MKKIIISALALAFVLSTGSVAHAYTPAKGDLIKTKNNPAVYYISANGERHLFATESTYWSWNAGTWKNQNIKVISQADFDKISSGKNVTMRPGTNLIKFGSSQIVFVVVPDRKLCYAESGFGDTYTKRFTNVPVSFEADYGTSRTCTITTYRNLPNGSLFSYKGSKDVYLVDNGVKRKVTAKGMTANEFKYDFVVKDVDPSMTYVSGWDINGFEPYLSLEQLFQ